MSKFLVGVLALALCVSIVENVSKSKTQLPKSCLFLNSDCVFKEQTTNGTTLTCEQATDEEILQCLVDLSERK